VIPAAVATELGGGSVEGFLDGFVVFAPLRRGHRGKAGSNIRSTGIWTDDYVADCLASGNCSCDRCDGGSFCSKNALEVDYVRQQYVDVSAQRFICKVTQSLRRGIEVASDLHGVNGCIRLTGTV
jgi:hypothetical protein